MPVSQLLNPKAAIKRSSNNDLPFSVAQPVINSYYNTTTLNQTVINVGFSIQVTGPFANTDVFWLFIDGKKLDLGSSNDYTFTAIASDGTSSQVTLTQGTPANLNIQAFKFGLKPEIEFKMDNRFVSLYAEMASGFQGFVSQTDNTISPTTTTGSPVAGTFYTTIVNRASMPDLTQDLKARMGVERIMVQSCFQIQNEFGPNGEQVYGIFNDTYGQIRAAGTGWATNQLGSFGQEIASSTVGDFVEITFYGTGLNVLTYAATTNPRSCSITVDGVASGTFTQSTASTSGVLAGLNYNPNVIINAVNGLSAGIHTVRLTIVTALDLEGFEILNTNSSNVIVQPGIGYASGQQIITSAQAAFAYNSVATGTKGGRVLVYQSSAGAISQAWQAVNTSSALLSSANHANEEVARTYYPREFGCGTTTDFSRINGSAQAARFTLDDGCTSLSATSALFQNLNGSEGVAFGATSNSFIFSFVGCGLDMQVSVGTLVGASFTYSIDGSAASAISFTNSKVTNVTIASGLAYGSHTFKLTLVAITSGSFSINNFMVYQPKKPSLPSGAVELADYNVMATFSTSTLNDATINGVLQVATGVLVKPIPREWLYTGANWSFASSPYPAGLDATTGTNNGQPATYTFFGTGAVLTWENSSGGTFSVTISIDGSLNAGGTALTNVTNAGGGTYTTTTSTTQIPARVAFSGLTLGMHTITIQRSAGTGNFFFDDVQIATPIHSFRSNVYADLQNTLPVGSIAINDLRKNTPVKDLLPARKGFSQAIGVTSGPTLGSASAAVPLSDMSCSIKTTGGPLFITFNAVVIVNSSFGSLGFQIYVDGVPQSVNKNLNISGTTEQQMIGDSIMVEVGPGHHNVVVFWGTVGNGATVATAIGTQRILTVKEL